MSNTIFDGRAAAMLAAWRALGHSVKEYPNSVGVEGVDGVNVVYESWNEAKVGLGASEGMLDASVLRAVAAILVATAMTTSGPMDSTP